MYTETFYFCVSQAPKTSRRRLFSKQYLLLTGRNLGEAFMEEKTFVLT